MTRKFKILAIFFLLAGSACALADETIQPRWSVAPAWQAFPADAPHGPNWDMPRLPQPYISPSNQSVVLGSQDLFLLPPPQNENQAEWFNNKQLVDDDFMRSPNFTQGNPNSLELIPPSSMSTPFRTLPPVTVSNPSEVWTDNAPNAINYSFAPEHSLDSMGRLPPIDVQVMPEWHQWPIASRLGWWSTSTSGSPIKIGEYQSLKSSLFWDVDRLVSNGVQTLDLSFTGLDEEATQLGLRYIGPQISAEVDYQRFLRRLDRDPLSFFVDFDKQPALPLPAPPANFRDMKEDMNFGEDFAIRVQELKSNFKGKLTKNVDWKLDFWGMRKHGERQVVALGHCFTAPNATDVNGNPVGGVACHVVSQRQRIDWLTMEVEPAVAARLGPVSVEYSRTMRTLTTDDQLTTRPYDNFGFNGNLPYAVVPENFTQIDRLKAGVDLPDRRSAYARLFIGNTENKLRDTNRRFRGYDVRLTDRSIDGLSITGYANNYVQKGQRPTVLLPLETAATIRTPIGYDRTKLGLRWRWRPFDGEMTDEEPYYRKSPWRDGLTLSGGYEYGELRRSNAVFTEQVLTADESSTTTNVARIRAAMRWSPHLDSFVGYRVGIITDPLFGVPIRNTTTNTSLPTEEHLIDIGTTWTPVDTMLLSASFGINNGGNTSDVARFQEDDYNIVLSGWYAPTPKWTASGGLAFYRNWIDQDITLGSKSTPLTQPWSFGGQSDVVNAGITYAWTESVTLSGGYEFVRGTNIAAAPFPYADIPPLSNVVVETSQLTAGVDYQLRQGIGCYLRYQYLDYKDKSQSFNSGTSNMLLFGADAVY